MEQIIDPQLATDIDVSEELNGKAITQQSNNNVLPEKNVTPSDCSCKTKPSNSVTSSSCGCGCGGNKAEAAKVYAIGSLGHEFQSEANRDAFIQDMDGNSPDDPVQLINYLRANPEAAEDVIWTLNIDSTPIYALCPSGGYAPVLHTRILEFYQAQVENVSHRVSVPGLMDGKIHLMSGQEIPVVHPKGQGLYSWSTEALMKAVLGTAPKKAARKGKPEAKFADLNPKEGLENFLDRVYYELRNFGVSSEDRALNFAATNAFNAQRVFEKTANSGLELDEISVERSPICRPNSDCWDVKLTFFNPTKRMEEARRVYRFTVDVSYVIPVSVGDVRWWSVF